MYKKMREGGRDVSDGEAKFEMTKKNYEKRWDEQQAERRYGSASRNSGI